MLKRRRVLTKDNFEQLLAWLHPDRDQAAMRYEAIRTSLIRILTWRGCNNAEDLADEAINRVAEKVDLLRETYVGDPAIYFYAVAKRLAKEEQRRATSEVAISEGYNVATFQDETDAATEDALYECLSACLRRAGPEKGRMILSYYSGERNVKIANRRILAEELGIPLNALRVRMHRMRASLENCIEKCVKSRTAELQRTRSLEKSKGKF